MALLQHLQFYSFPIHCLRSIFALLATFYKTNSSNSSSNQSAISKLRVIDIKMKVPTRLIIKLDASNKNDNIKKFSIISRTLKFKENTN